MQQINMTKKGLDEKGEKEKTEIGERKIKEKERRQSSGLGKRKKGQPTWKKWKNSSK